MKKQVDKSHYFNFKYNSKKRFISYWYQINTILKYNPKNVLEIGCGNKIVSDLLKKFGTKVTTVDIDENLEPDYVASIDKLPFEDNSFDVVCAFEVLEHLPFEMFDKALSEMKRVSRDKIIFSIPDKRPYVYFAFKIPIIPKIEIKVDLPSIYKEKHKITGQHYWELNKRGYQTKKIIKQIEKNGLKMEEHFRLKKHPYHHYFINKLQLV